MRRGGAIGQGAHNGGFSDKTVVTAGEPSKAERLGENYWFLGGEGRWAIIRCSGGGGVYGRHEGEEGHCIICPGAMKGREDGLGVHRGGVGECD